MDVVDDSRLPDPHTHSSDSTPPLTVALPFSSSRPPPFHPAAIEVRSHDNFLKETSFLPPPNEDVGILSTSVLRNTLAGVLDDLGIGDRMIEFRRLSITRDTIHARVASVRSIVPEDSLRTELLSRVQPNEPQSEPEEGFLAQERERMLNVGRTAGQKWFPSGLSGLGECLGQGATGLIHQVSPRPSEGAWPSGLVVKSARDSERNLLKEAIVLDACGVQSYVLISFGCVQLDGKLRIVLSMETDGTLADWIFHETERLSKQEKLNALRRISKGLCGIHRTGFAHCDLKPENILRDRRGGPISIADFGLSVRWEYCASGVHPRGTPGYMPPSFEGDPRKIDIFSFGILAWEVWTQKRAFSEERAWMNASMEGQTMSESQLEAFRRQQALVFVESIRYKRPNIACEECDDMPDELKELLPRCWCERHDERPTAEEVFRLVDSYC